MRKAWLVLNKKKMIKHMIIEILSCVFFILTKKCVIEKAPLV